MFQTPDNPNEDKGEREGSGFCKDCGFPAVGFGRLLCTFCREDREREMLDRNNEI